MNHKRIHLSEFITYLQERASKIPNDPIICYSDWLIKPEVYELATGEICIAEERGVTSYEVNGQTKK